ncbi:MAG: hypothetical protein ACE5IY_07020 [bacterium]
MALKHMSDQEIQELLDKRSSKDHSASAASQKMTEETHRQWQQYRALYDLLSQEPDMHLSPGFSRAVMARLAGEARTTSAVQLGQILLAIAGLVMGLGIAGYLMGMNTLASTLASGSKVLDSLSTYVSGLKLDFELLSAGIAMLVLMSVLDRLFAQSRERLISFFR